MRQFILLLSLFAFSFALVAAREDRIARLKRQIADAAANGTPFNGPTSVTTTRTAETFAGTVVQTCVINLSPIITPQGQNAVREERRCSTQLVQSNQAPAPAPAPAPPNAPPNAPPPSAPSPSAPSPNAPPAPASESKATTTTTTTTTAASQTSTTSITQSVPTPAGPSPSLFTTTATPARDTTPPSSTSSTTISTATSTTTPVKESQATPIGTTTKNSTPLPDNAPPASSQTSPAAAATSPATAASAESSAQATPFTLPGKKIEVLPIGLGVFAGISVIALIVVGLVTYERTKYRKAFRQRKLAEQGAGMGYNGMSERA